MGFMRLTEWLAPLHEVKETVPGAGDYYYEVGRKGLGENKD